MTASSMGIPPKFVSKIAAQYGLIPATRGQNSRYHFNLWAPEDVVVFTKRYDLEVEPPAVP
jgi:hypothetical protein